MLNKPPHNCLGFHPRTPKTTSLFFSWLHSGPRTSYVVDVQVEVVWKETQVMNWKKNSRLDRVKD